MGPYGSDKSRNQRTQKRYRAATYGVRSRCITPSFPVSPPGYEGIQSSCLVAKHQASAPAAPEPLGIGTAAYDEVKELWTKWGIWNNRWSVLPGRTWLHEHPFEDLLHNEVGEALPLLAQDAALVAALANQLANQRPLQPHLFEEDSAHATN